MKKLILIQIYLFSIVSISCAQSVQISSDSLNNSPNPGRYYIDILKQATEWEETDTVEGDEKHGNARELSFWLDRITGGNNVDSPFYKYSYMMRNYTRASCDPLPGHFNGNWENTGPKSTTQQQGRVYDMYIKPVALPNLPTEMWLGAGMAGLWKTTNGGVNWTCVSDTWPWPGIRGAGVQAIAVNPFDPDEMFVATKVQGDNRRNLMTWEYGQGIWHSTNAGVNWTIDPTISNFQSMEFMEYCPFQVNGTDEMIIATNYEHVWQKIGSGSWTDITPPQLQTFPRLIRDITFGPNGKFWVSTQHNWILGSFYGPIVIEFTYNAAGVVALNPPTIIEHTNNANGFVFDLVPDAPALVFETDYAGNNQLYVMVVADNVIGANMATEGHHTLYSYNIITGALTVEFPMPFCNPMPCKSLWRASVDVSPNNPDIVYIEGVRNSRLWRDALGNWQQYQYPNTGGAFHDDGLRTYIYHTDPSGNFANDIVYWGNDGGLTRTIGNAQANLNGDLITNEVYDIDVAALGKKRAVATFDNGLHGISNNNVWQYVQNDPGDGFSAIYDKRFTPFDMRLLFHNNDFWTTYVHNNTALVAGAYPFQDPRRSAGIDLRRPFEFPHAFDNGFMYAGNRNMLRSANMGYATGVVNWDIVTMGGVGGYLDGSGNTVKDHCRAIAVSPAGANQMMYFGLRAPDFDIASNKYKVVFARNPTTGGWEDETPNEIANGGYNLTDIVIDPYNPKRIFISLGMVRWSGPDHERVLEGIWNPATQDIDWTDMSTGLSQLPVTCLAYQNGAWDNALNEPADVIYAGTDAGVYRWDKPQHCWVKFDDALAGSGAKMPNVVVHDLVIDYCNLKLVMGSYSRGVWESDLYLPNFFPDPTEIISSNTTWNANRIVEGSVLVQTGNTLTITGTPNANNNTQTTSTTTIFMPKYGKIIVEKGARLVVQGARITNECGGTWMGIFANGNGNAYQQQVPPDYLFPNHGLVEITDAIIENAEEALNNGGGSDIPNTGGVIRVFRSHFINNHRSVAFYEYHNQWGALLKPDNSFIKNSRFDVDDDARIPFYAHISLWGVRGIKIDLNIFNNTQTLSTTIPDHSWAVYSIDAGYGFVNNTVNNMYKGLEASNFNLDEPLPLALLTNTFDGNEIGIHLRNMTYPRILGNTINIGAKQTFNTLPNGYFSLGSKMEFVNNFKYVDNTLNKLYPSPSSQIFQYTAGTEVYYTGDKDEQIHRNNYMGGLLIGNDANFQCGLPPNGLVGLRFTCNTNVGNELYDFVFQEDAIISETQYGNAPGSATNNTFSNNATVSNWHHISGPISNAPVTYEHQNIANHTPSLNPLNVIPQIKPAGVCSTMNTFALAKLENNNYEELTAGELSSLKTQYATNEANYNPYKTLYLQLLDEGNTEALVEEINNATIANQLITRAEFLALSPYVSQTALRELALQEIVSNPILLEILIANPDATRDESFIEFLELEMANPLPLYMIDLIRASWSGPQTARTTLEQNLSFSHNQMSVLKNHIIYTYRLNDTLQNEDSAFVWMQKVPGIRNTYELI